MDYVKQLKRKAKRLLETTAKHRKCDGCTACCTVLGVASIDKPEHVPCKHLCQIGCAVHSTKPEECNAYSCLWKIGAIAQDKYRPDKIGLIFDMINREPECLLMKYKAISCREVWKNASEAPEAAQLLKVVSLTVPVIIMDENGRPFRIIGPESLVKSMWKEYQEKLANV